MFDFDKYCLDGEVWVDVPGFENYQASNLGRIRRISKSSEVRQILKPKWRYDKTGYRVCLYKHGIRHYMLVARIICLTFHGKPPNKLTVNHKDGNRLNNHIDNLEWLTLADNIRHGFYTGLYPSYKVSLNINGIIHTFYSQSKASLFIGRSKGYLSERINKGKDAFDIYGNKIQIVGD